MSLYPTNLLSTNCATIAPLELKVSGPGWDGGERRVFEQPFVLVGRNEGNCLRLEDHTVSRRHAYLQQFGDRVFCVDLGSRSGTHWGSTPRSAGWLHPNQAIQIGPFTLELANTLGADGTLLEESAEASNPLQDRIDDQSHMPRFSIAFGKEVRKFRMNRKLVLVGSSPDCRVSLRDVGISRYHCSLVRTPEGVWVIDLLSVTGSRLNGEPIRGALVREGDLLQIGPYLLRFDYEEEAASTHSTVLPLYRTETPLQTELNQLRERLRDMETLQQRLTDREAECVRLREQAGALEVQTVELADLKGRLETAEAEAGKWESVCRERDQWLEETQILRTQIASDMAEREDLRQQLETAYRQLAEEREAIAVANAQVEQQSVALQQLQETQQQLAGALDKTTELQAELDQARQHQRDAEALRLQLADAHSQHEQLVIHTLDLEAKAASLDGFSDRLRASDAETERLREQLQAAQMRMTELEALQTECVQLREQARLFEAQVTELADFAARHESGVAEREDLQQQLETAHRQLTEKREAVAAANARVERLQETQQELARALDETNELQAELEQTRRHQRDAEVLRLQLADAHSRHEQLAIHALELEEKVASLDNFSDRLRAADAETERLREQLQASQTRYESSATEREDLRQQLETVHRQLAEERETVVAANARVEQHSAALRQLQETQQELARALDERSELQAELDQARQHQRDAEALRQRLMEAGSRHEQHVARLQELEGRAASADRLEDRLRDANAETEQLREQSRVLAIQVAEAADLAARLEAAETEANKLEEVCRERDHWQAQTQALQTRIASDMAEREHFDRLTAEFHAVEEERDRLLTEQQMSPHEAEQAWNRVSELERALKDTADTHERNITEERARWESERQVLEDRLMRAREVQSQVEAANRKAQACLASEGQNWKQRLEAAEAQILCERGLFQEQSEQFHRQTAVLQAERDRLAARLAQAELTSFAAPPYSVVPAAPLVAPAPMPQLCEQDQALAAFLRIPPDHTPKSPIVPAGTAPSSNSSDAAPREIVIAEEKQTEENSPLPLSRRQNEEARGLLRKVLNIVLRK